MKTKFCELHFRGRSTLYKIGEFYLSDHARQLQFGQNSILARSKAKIKNWKIINCFLVVDTRSVETTIAVGRNVQMCHSLRCKQIDMSTATQLISIQCRRGLFLRESLILVAAAHARVTELVERRKMWLWTLNAKSYWLGETFTCWSSKLTGAYKWWAFYEWFLRANLWAKLTDNTVAQLISSIIRWKRSW